MILGIGIDLVEVARMKSACERQGDRFLQRILRPEEIAYCRQHVDPSPYIAARFAAKEAVSKAFGTGIGAALGWLDIEIGRLASGQPTMVLHGVGAELQVQHGVKTIHVSLSHTETYATAMVILEGCRASG